MLALGMEMILKIAGGCCRVLLQRFTCSPLVFHRKRKDAQAGASLQASHHGGQCHLVPGAPMSLPRQARASAPPQLLCASVLPSLTWDRATGEAGETSLDQTLSKPLHPRGENSPAEIPAAPCVAAPWEAPSPLGRSSLFLR